MLCKSCKVKKLISRKICVLIVFGFLMVFETRKYKWNVSLLIDWLGMSYMDSTLIAVLAIGLIAMIGNYLLGLKEKRLSGEKNE